MSRDSFASLAGRTILYTGAAGGLGLETTLAMLRTGARVVAVDNSETKIAALQQAAEGLAGLTIIKAHGRLAGREDGDFLVEAGPRLLRAPTPRWPPGMPRWTAPVPRGWNAR